MDPTDTLSGTYGTATITLPDGSQVPVLARKITTGDKVEWVVIDDRVIALEARFADTACKPDDFTTPRTDVLVKHTTIATANEERSLASGNLIQFLGDPDRIIANKALDPERLAHIKAHPSSLTLARALCQVAGSKWVQVLQYLPKVYPETRPK
jgi:hypothetical protein